MNGGPARRWTARQQTNVITAEVTESLIIQTRRVDQRPSKALARLSGDNSYPHMRYPHTLITSTGIDGDGGVTRQTTPEGRTRLQQRTGRSSVGRGVEPKAQQQARKSDGADTAKAKRACDRRDSETVLNEY
ncbi:unnamed protein product [Macrosiphum euphorbiae]|nr:unnamed protein product [Macrosiphum euphorbiae]